MDITPPADSGEDLALKLLYDEESKEPEENVDSTEHIKFYMSMRDNGDRTRKAYVESLTGAPRKRVDNEIARIDKLRKDFFANPTKTELVKEHLNCRALWRAEAIANQRQNIEDLERRKDQFENEVEPRKSLSDQLEPEKKWLDKVFKKSAVHPDSTGSDEEAQKDEHQEFENRAFRQRMFRNEERILNSISKWDHKPEETPTKPTNDSATAKEKMKYNIKAGIMYFHGEGTDKKNEHVQGVFPHQKIPIEILLNNGKNNPLLEPSSHEDGPIRYFHLPTNNMAWVEVSLITCQIDYELIDPDQKFVELYYSQVPKDKAKKGPAERLLAYQNWQGQIHGGTEHPVHARHLRPRCLTVQSELKESRKCVYNLTI